MKLISPGYTEPSIEGLYSNLQKDLMPLAHVRARHDSGRSKPSTAEEFRVLFINKVELSIQETINTIQSIILPTAGIVVAKKYMADAEAEVKPLQATLEDTELDERALQEQQKSVNPNLQKRLLRICIYIAAAIVAAAEGVFAYDAFRHTLLSPAVSLIASVAISLSLGFGTHLLAGYLKQAISRKQFLIRLSETVIPIFIAFFMLGNMRSTASAIDASLSLDPYQRIIPESTVSAIGITTLSFLLFAAALLFSYRFYKTSQEEQADAEYDRCCEALRQCEGEQDAIREKITAIRDNARQQSALALARYEYAVAMEQRLISLGKRVVQEYIQKNIRYRSDTTIPSFFSNPPQMRFRLFFDNVKKHTS